MVSHPSKDHRPPLGHAVIFGESVGIYIRFTRVANV